MTATRSIAPPVDTGRTADKVEQRPAGIARRFPAVAQGAMALPFASAAVAVGCFWLVRGALIDDAYITLSYARNVATDLHWGLIPTEPANSATSPLNVILLAAATALLRVTGDIHPVWGLAVVFVGLAALLGHWWRQIREVLRLPAAVPVLGAGILLTNPFVLSAAGLEVLLVPTMLVGLLATATRGQPVAFGAIAGLAVLSRLDLIIFVAPMALATPAIRRRLPQSVAAAVAVSLPWFAWSWVHFGSAIPDTFVIKTLQRSFGPSTFVNGWRLYAERDGLATAVTFLPGIAAAAAVVIWLGAWAARRDAATGVLAPAAALGLGGLLYLGAYAAMEVPPYQWYYVPSFAALTTSLCVLAGAALRGRQLPVRTVGVTAVAGLAILLALNVVADLRHGAPWRHPVVFGNWAIPADYERVGRDLGARVGDETVIAPPEVGTLAYFCECSIVDAFADRGRVVPLIDERIAAAGPLARRALDLNYLLLDHDQLPRPARYQLIWEPGPPTGADQWETWSPAAGVGHMTLIELPPQT